MNKYMQLANMIISFMKLAPVIVIVIVIVMVLVIVILIVIVIVIVIVVDSPAGGSIYFSESLSSKGFLPSRICTLYSCIVCFIFFMFFGV